jgi:hypothetical protein
MKILLWMLPFLLVPAAAAAQQTPPNAAELHSEIQELYRFQPHLVDAAGRAQKSALMDQFWMKAKAQSGVYLPMLRRELADFQNPPFFLYDGSELLMSLSSDPSDRKVVLAAVAHADLADVQLMSYFTLVHNMAALGENTTAAAFHILAQPQFQVFVPQHALTLKQDFCLIYMLFPTDMDYWLQPSIDRLATESDVTAQQSLLLLLWYAQTQTGDKAIQDFSTNARVSQTTRDYAKELLQQKDSRDLVGVPKTNQSEESLRQARRDRLKAVSDEALDDFNTYTAQIISKRK